MTILGGIIIFLGIIVFILGNMVFDANCFNYDQSNENEKMKDQKWNLLIKKERQLYVIGCTLIIVGVLVIAYG